MLKYIKQHPFGAVLLVAAILRLLAVLFSKGYMASDDHFETINIVLNWINKGMWGPDGYLVWARYQGADISRFPLYTLLLYLNVKAMLALGAETLDQIMYGVRLSHAACSMIAVAAVYKTVELSTRSQRWAVLGGLMMAAHFAAPFLAVRNLIEMMGGTFWVAAMYFFYRYDGEKREKWLVWAGIMSGLAWMFRFQLILAFGIIPIVLWFVYRKLRPTVYYSVAVLLMVLVSGVTDRLLVGVFLGTSLNHLWQGLSAGPAYTSSMLMYAEVLVAYFIPPFSLIVFYLMARKRFWQKHAIIFFSSLSFFLLHTLISSRQERYMIPILPALIVMTALVLYQHWNDQGFLFRRKKLFRSVIGFTIAVNAILLIAFTFNYAHRGLVEPLVRIDRMSDKPAFVLFFSPQRGLLTPNMYGGIHDIPHDYVFNWDVLESKLPIGSRDCKFDYIVVYPPTSEALAAYVDTIQTRIGAIEPISYISPSIVDWVLHKLNPKHNPNYEAWIYRPESRPKL